MISINKNKTKKIFCCVFSILILLLCCFIYKEYYRGLVAAVLFILFSFLHIVFPNKARGFRLLHYLIVIVLSFSLSSIILFSNLFLFQYMDTIKIVLNIFGIFALCLIFYTITLNERLSVAVGSGLVLAFFIINIYVYTFRGRELAPLDIRSIKTALNVADNYDLSLDFPIFRGIMIWSISIISLWTISYDKNADISPSRASFLTSIKRRIIPLILSGIIVCMFCFACSKVEIHPWGFDGTQTNGFLVNFTANFLNDAKIRSYPEYSSDNVIALEKEYFCPNETIGNNDQPSIFVIMDESFADLRLLDNVGVIPEDVMPFYDSLKENTIKGYALSSVFGGNTSNSEYEFLTGNTMGFISANANVYQQFLNGKYSSMATILNNLGYKSIGTHPYLATNWQRDKIYPMLGFHELLFGDEYPQKKLIRNFISDSEMFEKIIDVYNQTYNSEKLFLFGVTIQNHGGYTISSGPEIPVFGLSQQYPDAEQYLGLIHETDSALEKLISYFKSVDDKVLVVFFGDHLPALNNSFFDEIYGKSFDTLDDQQTKFAVPFFIWANYDIEEKTLPCTSLNFLSNYVYEAAGLQPPPYNSFLKTVESVIPAMNAYGFYSKENSCFMKYDDAEGEEKYILEKYRTLQYNSLFDRKNPSPIFFPLEK